MCTMQQTFLKQTKTLKRPCTLCHNGHCPSACYTFHNLKTLILEVFINSSKYFLQISSLIIFFFSKKSCLFQSMSFCPLLSPIDGQVRRKARYALAYHIKYERQRFFLLFFPKKLPLISLSFIYLNMQLILFKDISFFSVNFYNSLLGTLAICMKHINSLNSEIFFQEQQVLQAGGLALVDHYKSGQLKGGKGQVHRKGAVKNYRVHGINSHVSEMVTEILLYSPNTVQFCHYENIVNAYYR